MRAKPKRELMATLNITPMVDIAFTLLVIFMMTAPLLQQGMPVNLPKAHAQDLKRTQTDLILTIQGDGKMFIGEDSTPILSEQLEEKLRAIYATKMKKDIFLKADENLQYKTIIKVMSVAKLAGVDRIGMLTQPEIR